MTKPPTEKLIQHREWIKSLIKSCITIEQLDSCQTLIVIFLINLKKTDVDPSFIMQSESELLEQLLIKSAII